MLFALVSTLIVFLAAPVHSVKAACSSATLYNNGTYTWLEEVTYPSGGAYAAYVTFLSSGSWAGTVYGGTGGSISTTEISGTYTVNSNCTLTLTFSGGFTTQGIIVSSGNEVFLNEAASGETYLVDLKPLGTVSCSDATVYNIENYGVVSQTLYPALGNTTGYLSFAPTGNMAGVISGGTTGSYTSWNISGTYTVNSNCTLTLSFSSGYTWEGVVQSSGDQIFLVQGSPTGDNVIFVLTKE
jgi:hypothetical protein